MHHPTDRITHTTAFVTPVMEHWLEREIAQWVGGTCLKQYYIYTGMLKYQIVIDGRQGQSQTILCPRQGKIKTIIYTKLSLRFSIALL